MYNVDFDSSKTPINLNNNQITGASNHIHEEEKVVISQTKTTVKTKKETEEIIISPDLKLPELNKETIKYSTDISSEIQPPNETIVNDITLVNFGNEKTDTLDITDESNNTDSKPVLPITPPSADFFIEKTICEGNDINLLAVKASENFDYSWKLNDDEIISGKVISMKANLVGENKVTLFIKQDGLQIAKKESTFTVLETPINNVKIELNQTALVNELMFEMEDASNQIVWNFGDGVTSAESNTIHTYKKAGKYTCKYTVIAKNGCSASFERNINVKGYYNLRTDYGFSPGKRDNINDVFIPVELRELDIPFEMSIYARNGQLLYTSTFIDKPWDGRMKDGSTCTFGSYIWVLSLTNKLGEKEVYKGTVTNVSN